MDFKSCGNHFTIYTYSKSLLYVLHEYTKTGGKADLHHCHKCAKFTH